MPWFWRSLDVPVRVGMVEVGGYLVLIENLCTPDLCNDDSYRGITPEEISALEATGNLAEPSSWSSVRVHKVLICRQHTTAVRTFQ